MNARNVRNTPSRSVVRHSRHAARVMSRIGTVGPATPALATTACTRPIRPTSSASAATERSSAASHASGTALWPADSISPTVAVNVAGFRAVAATTKPSAASPTAMARPMPRLAPVTTATRSLIGRSMRRPPGGG